MNTTNKECYSILEEEILTFKLKPGEILSENHLSERFQLSRTPIREVLHRLEVKGLVEIVPKKGTVVTQLDYNIIGQMIYLRVTVESRILEDFISACTPMDIERVRYALTALQVCASPIANSDATGLSSEFDSSLFTKLDFQMHKIWFETTGKEYLWSKLIWEDPNYSRFCALDIINQKNVQNTLSDHQAIMDLIDEHNTSDVYSLMEKHLYGGMKRLGARMAVEFKDYFKPLPSRA